MYQYVLAQADKIPIIFQHQEKITQEEFLRMFNMCLSLYHQKGNSLYNHKDVAEIMEKEFGFEQSVIELAVFSPSNYPGLFKDEELIKTENVIHTPFNYKYWKENKERKRA